MPKILTPSLVPVTEQLPLGSQPILDGLHRRAWVRFGGSSRTQSENQKDYEFARTYLKDTALFPEDTPGRWFEPAPFHEAHSDLADESARLILRRFRDSAKSTQFTVVRPIRRICENRNIRMVVISKIKEIAARFVITIGRQLQHNAKIIEKFGAFYTEDESWTQFAFTVIRSADFKEPTLQAVGRGGQIVSGRYELVILDDVEDFESTRIDTRREGTYNWFQRDVVPVVVPGGQILIIQTPQHEMDLVGQVQKQRIWKIVTTPAEVPAPDAPGSIKRASTWPGKFPIYWQSAMWGRPCAVEQVEGKHDATLRAQDGSIIPDDEGQPIVLKARGGSRDAMHDAAAHACPNCPVYNPRVGENLGMGCLTGKQFVEIDEVAYKLQYLCNLSALAGDIFKKEWARYYHPHEVTWEKGAWWYQGPGQIRPYEISVRMGIDPAIADETDLQPDAHSKFAVTVLGWVPQLRRRLVLAFFNERISWPEQIEVAVEMFMTWHPIEVITEEVGYQVALKQALSAYGIPVRGQPQDRDKFRRFVVLAPEVRAGNLYMREEIIEKAGGTVIVHPQEEWWGQFTSFPNTTFMDCIDSYELAQRFLNESERMFQEYAEKAAKVSDPEDSPHVIVPAPTPKAWTLSEVMNGWR